MKKGHEKEKNVKIDYTFGSCAVIIIVTSHFNYKKISNNTPIEGS